MGADLVAELDGIITQHEARPRPAAIDRLLGVFAAAQLRGTPDRRAFCARVNRVLDQQGYRISTGGLHGGRLKMVGPKLRIVFGANVCKGFKNATIALEPLAWSDLPPGR